MYESPIDIQELTRDIQEKIKQDQEEKVMECICEYGINVDKEELIKALQYDRNQYKKGFADALDRIREEIMELDVDYDFEGFYKCQAEVLAIIDKCRLCDVVHRDRTVQDFVDKCRECGRKKVFDKISEEVDDLRNYSYLVPDMIFDEVQRVIDKYKE